ncbi:hypothetical protein [Rhizobium sp. BT03]|uniref:DnaT-like ssDNA-binding protein n=1 Tax=Rhizobium sp. BT03 TaxID=3045156 RepID=UPI0024B3D481|nr:hypothetical protein [Rhizobium sp. BT03]WHO75626.1 hypothetical protein QMO80_004727 [Rhizobium sp. BT03]
MKEFKRLQIPTLRKQPGTDCSEIVAEAAFALASGIIDTIPFIGSKLDEQQARAWPRSGVFTDDGVEMTGTPPEIFELCELLAAHIEKGSSFDVFEVFHKIARIERLIDWRQGGLLCPESEYTRH